MTIPGNLHRRPPAAALAAVERYRSIIGQATGKWKDLTVRVQRAVFDGRSSSTRGLGCHPHSGTKNPVFCLSQKL
jgi:hypothetical protein